MRCHSGETVGSGPFFKAYLANLLPGQFIQPFVDAAFSDLGLDPHVLVPSATSGPTTGQPATPPLPMPYPRTGQGGEPRLNLPDAITGKPGDPRYPYRDHRCRHHRRAAPHPGRPRRHRADHARRAGPTSTDGRPALHRNGDSRWEVAMSALLRSRTWWRSLLIAALTGGCHGALAARRHRAPHDGHRVLRKQQRHLRRRRGAHPRHSGRQDRQDRTAARTRAGSRSGSTTNTGARRRQGRDHLADSDLRARHPADPRLHKRSHPDSGAVMARTAPRFRSNGTICVNSSKSSTQTLQPTQPGGVAPAGDFINVAADNLRGNGGAIRDTLIKLSQAASALGDHSSDIFTVVRNLALLVSALQGSSQLMGDLNVNLAAVTRLLTNSPGEISDAVTALSQAVRRTQQFRRRQPRAPGQPPSITSPRSPPRSTNPTTISSRFCTSRRRCWPITSTSINPPKARSPGALAFNNFADPIQFICGAVEAASRWVPNSQPNSASSIWRRSSRIVNTTRCPWGSTRSWAMARPNEITYSEDRLRPDYVPPPRQPRRRTAAPPTTQPPPHRHRANRCRPRRRCRRRFPPTPPPGFPG